MKDNNENKSFKQQVFRPRLFFWCAVLAIPVAVLFKQYLELRATYQQLEAEQQKQQAVSQQIQENEKTKEKLKKADPFIVEKEAREKLNFVKPGEVVLKLSTTTTANSR
ncbi:MAG: septum formation initiator family protein [bacterium]|nr:septum formation initiator family protein [bacterium]